MFRYKVACYKEERLGRLHDAVSVLVSGKSRTVAINKAKKAVKKKHYRILEVAEIGKSELERYTDYLMDSESRRQGSIGDRHQDWVKVVSKQTRELARIADALEYLRPSGSGG